MDGIITGGKEKESLSGHTAGSAGWTGFWGDGYCCMDGRQVAASPAPSAGKATWLQANCREFSIARQEGNKYASECHPWQMWVPL